MRNDLIEAYNRHARQREASPIQPWKAEQRASFLARLQQEGKCSLLEISAGPGRDSLFFAQQSLDVRCIDLSPEMARLCQQKGVAASVMDMAALSFTATSTSNESWPKCSRLWFSGPSWSKRRASITFNRSY